MTFYADQSLVAIWVGKICTYVYDFSPKGSLLIAHISLLLNFALALISANTPTIPYYYIHKHLAFLNEIVTIPLGRICVMVHFLLSSLSWCFLMGSDKFCSSPNAFPFLCESSWMNQFNAVRAMFRVRDRATHWSEQSYFRP